MRELERVGQSPTVMTRVFNMRQSLQHKILNSSLSEPTQALVIAMLLGNDDFIEPLVRNDFSRAGVAHVLALSGLHVAVITLIIWFLLFPLDYLRGKKLRLVLTLVILVGYDLLTGMSPSVIRATVMIAFVFMSMIFYRKSTPLNAVATAALAILVFSPSALYSVGFQLSFITVVALIVFYQYFKIKMPASKVLNYVYSILLTSAVAMASTIVLTAYYFNTMSFMSIGANVLIMCYSGAAGAMAGATQREDAACRWGGAGGMACWRSDSADESAAPRNGGLQLVQLHAGAVFQRLGRPALGSRC